MDQIVSRHGVPVEVHTDQGKNFESKVFREVLYYLGIRKTRTTALHPQSDGQVERQHQTILNYLSKFVSENQKDWDDYVPLYLLAYRSSKHEATGYSPAELYFAQEPRLPLDLLRGSPPDCEKVNSIVDYIQKLKRKIEVVHNNARRTLDMRSLQTKMRYDRKAREIRFAEGQNVWFFNPRRIKGRPPKLQNNWKGLYKIIKKLNDIVFRIQKSKRHRNKVVHADRLAPYYERQVFD